MLYQVQCVSKEFGISYFVAVLSYVTKDIICVYFDELLKRLESAGMVCYIGHDFYGCVGYADDVKVLCPSINGIQAMINEHEKFADEYGHV